MKQKEKITTLYHPYLLISTDFPKIIKILVKIKKYNE